MTVFSAASLIYVDILQLLTCTFLVGHLSRSSGLEGQGALPLLVYVHAQTLSEDVHLSSVVCVTLRVERQFVCTTHRAGGCVRSKRASSTLTLCV